MERYEIYIKGNIPDKKKTNVAGEDEKKKSNVAGEDKQEEKNEKKGGIATAKIIAKQTLSEVRTLIVPHIAEYTRDSLLQKKVDSAFDILDTAIAFYVNPVYGAINMANKGISTMTQYFMDMSKESNRLSVALRRSSNINRSRD